MKKCFFLIFFVLTGCSTSGNSGNYKPPIKETIANNKTIEIYYYNECESCYVASVQRANSHCASFNKSAIPARKSYMTISGLGNTVITFLCE